MIISCKAGEFPAHVAAREGNLQLLSMLIKEGHCGINDKDRNGSTPAHKGVVFFFCSTMSHVTHSSFRFSHSFGKWTNGMFAVAD